MKPWAWDVFTRRPAPTLGILAELSQVHAAPPGYDVIVTSHSPAYRFEATPRPGPGPWCVISTDPADLWRELPIAPVASNAGIPAASAP
jgi:hypothetical protein